MLFGGMLCAPRLKKVDVQCPPLQLGAVEVRSLSAPVCDAAQGGSPEVTTRARSSLAGGHRVVQAQDDVANNPDVGAPADAVFVEPHLRPRLGGGGRFVGAFVSRALAALSPVAAQDELD